MIKIKYQGELQCTTLDDYCKKYLVSKIFKLLPLKEENRDWDSYLINLNCELVGASEILLKNIHFLSLMNKLEGLRSITKHEEYRAIVFDCIRMAEKLPDNFGDLS